MYKVSYFDTWSCKKSDCWALEHFFSAWVFFAVLKSGNVLLYVNPFCELF